jgi:hypothetical protein
MATKYNEVGCYSYADAETCKGDVLDVLTIHDSEYAWAKRHHHIRHFINHQEKQGRGTVIIYSVNPARG